MASRYGSMRVLFTERIALTYSGRCISIPQRLPKGAQGGPPIGFSTQLLQTCARTSLRYSCTSGSIVTAHLRALEEKTTPYLFGREPPLFAAAQFVRGSRFVAELRRCFRPREDLDAEDHAAHLEFIAVLQFVLRARTDWPFTGPGPTFGFTNLLAIDAGAVAA